MTIPQPYLLVWAGIFGVMTGIHLTFCHVGVMLFSLDWDWFVEHTMAINLNFCVMHVWGCICGILALTHASLYGDFSSKVGGVIKLLAVLTWFLQDVFALAEFDDGFWSSTIATFIFACGGIVHTVAFRKNEGLCTSSTLGMMALCVGAFMALVFFHVAFCAGLDVSGGFWIELGPESKLTPARTLCTFMVLVADGLVVAGSALLLGNVVDSMNGVDGDAHAQKTLKKSFITRGSAAIMVAGEPVRGSKLDALETGLPPQYGALA